MDEEYNKLQTALNELNLAYKEFKEVANTYEVGMLKIKEVIQRLISDEMVDRETKAAEEDDHDCKMDPVGEHGCDHPSHKEGPEPEEEES